MITRAVAHFVLLALLHATTLVGQPSPSPFDTSAINKNSRWISLVSGGMQRRYLLHPPSGVSQPDANWGLVVVFHGGKDTPEKMEKISGFSELADREVFAVAYAEAIGQKWNDGRDVPTATGRVIDDVQFARDIVADAKKRQGLDPKKIYAAGASDGGMMVCRLACEASDIFAAIGMMAAGIPVNLVHRCKPDHPVAVIGIQSVDEPLEPYTRGFGDVGRKSRVGLGGTVEGAMGTQYFFAKTYGCSTYVKVDQLPPPVGGGPRIERYTHSGGRAEVVWYNLRRERHQGPPPSAQSESSFKHIDAADVVWKFFKQHPKP